MSLILVTFSLFALALTYAGYPMIVLILSRFRRPINLPEPTRIPTVSVIVPTHNETNQIDGKLKNILSLDESWANVEVLVSDDGSTDDTVTRAEAWSDQFTTRGWTFQVIRGGSKEGKAIALNRAVQRASAEILVFTDADSRWEPFALRQLLTPFVDPRIGCVSGRYVPVSHGSSEDDQEDHTGSIGLYWRYEDLLRRAESRLWTILGATGALLAVRRALYEPMPRGLINDDFFVAMSVARKGQRAVYEPRAVCREWIENDARSEYQRRVRIMAGNWQLIWMHLSLLAIPRQWGMVLQLAGHKLLRVLSPFFLITLAIASITLLFSSGPRYICSGLYLLAGQSLVYCSALAYSLPLNRQTQSFGFVRSCHLFVLMNLAALHGLWYFIFRGAMVPWKTRNVR